MQEVTKAWERPPLEKYNKALLVLLGVSGALHAISLLWHSPISVLLLPIEAGAITALCTVALYRFCLSRQYNTSLASFSAPIILSIICPVFILIINIIMRVQPQNINALGELADMALASVFSGIYPIASVILCIFAIVKSVLHYLNARDEQSILIKWLPLGISIIGAILSAFIVFFTLSKYFIFGIK
ncbi:MAG: hypothetical protein RR654_02475 [Oscillospiraceae bacterium]